MGGDVYKRRYPRVNPQEVGVLRWRLVSKKAGNFAAKTFAHGRTVAGRARKTRKKKLLVNEVVNLTNFLQ